MKTRTYAFQLAFMLAMIVSMSLSAGAHKLDKHHSSSSASHEAHFHKFKDHFMIISNKGHHDKWKRTNAINPVTNEPYVFWFVNNSFTFDGNGTFEYPFNTLVDAQNNSNPNDIIYVLTGTGTDFMMDAGITLKNGQKLLGAGISQHVLTTLGDIEIPTFSIGLPALSNTLSTAPIGKSVVTMNAGDNVVSGFLLLDNIGSGAGNADVSAGVLIQNGTNYEIKNNTMKTFFHGNCINIYGGGDVTVSSNTCIGLDADDTFGVDLFAYLEPLHGFFVFENNHFTGANAASGFDQGIHIEPADNAVIPGSKGIIGNLTITIANNICDSQTNTAHDSPQGIVINARPPAFNPIYVEITGNQVTLPTTVTGAVGGIDIAAHGPGPVHARVYNNVSITPTGIPGFKFSTFGNPGNLNLDLGFDNIGKVTIVP